MIPIVEEKETNTGGEEITGKSKGEEIIDELELEFNRFKSTKTEHNSQEEEEHESESSDFIPDENNISEVEQFEVQMFLGFCFTLIDGLHVWVYKYISKHEITDEELSLNDKEQEALMKYFQTKRVLAIIRKLPSELIGFVHMEWMYYRKYRNIAKAKEKEEEEKSKLKLIDAYRKIKSRNTEKIKETKFTERRAPIKKAPVKKAAKKKPKKRATVKKEKSE